VEQLQLVEILKFIHLQDQELLQSLVRELQMHQITVVSYIVVAGGGGGGAGYGGGGGGAGGFRESKAPDYSLYS
jgi:hypothetical protein